MRTHPTCKMRKSDQFLDLASSYGDLVFVLHDNPDPDGLAAGWALGELAHQKLKRPFRLMARGTVQRAENQQLLSLLKPPLDLVEAIRPTPRSLVVLVDCRPEALNHAPVDSGALAVVDHHERIRKPSVAVQFQDIRPRVAATASIAASYLREQRVDPGPRLATALAYAIRTEVSGGSVSFSLLDRQMLGWVSRHARPDLLAEIEEAPLPRSYFTDLTRALSNTVLHDDCAFCMLPASNSPETISEVSDLLSRCEGIDAVLCCGRFGDSMKLSTRTRRASARHAADLVAKVVDGLGHSRGHEHRAGGNIELNDKTAEHAWFTQELKKRWMSACGLEGKADAPLVRPCNGGDLSTFGFHGRK